MGNSNMKKANLPASYVSRGWRELFSIELEKPVRLSEGRFEKSGTTKAKIDIWISFENQETKAKHSCAIELKFFKQANHREPNNRYDVFSDIQNLEAYGDCADLGFLIVATDHHHYVRQDSYSIDTADFDFRHEASYESGTILTYKTDIVSRCLEPSLTQTQELELDRRLADHLANPDDVIPWGDIKAAALRVILQN